MPDRDPDDLPPLPEPGSSPPEPSAPPSGPYVVLEPPSPHQPPPTPPTPPGSSTSRASTPHARSSPPTWPTSPPVAGSPIPPLAGDPAPPAPPLPPAGRPAGESSWWGRPWVLGTFAAVSALALIVGAVAMVVSVQGDGVARASGDRPTTTAEAGGTARSTTTEVGVVTATTALPTTTTTAPPAPGFGEGLQRVGVDIQPGRYLAAEVGFACYWERVSGFGGTLDDVIMNGNAQGSQAIVEVLPSDAGFTSHDCGRWVAYSAPPAPATSFDDGDWSVGEDVLPGAYRSNGGPLCWWERAVGFTHDLDDEIVDYGTPAEPVTVTIAAGERFTSLGCGPWTPA